MVPQTVLYLPVKFRDNPSFVYRSGAVLVLGFNRGHVRVLCFLGQKPKKSIQTWPTPHGLTRPEEKKKYGPNVKLGFLALLGL